MAQFIDHQLQWGHFITSDIKYPQCEYSCITYMLIQMHRCYACGSEDERNRFGWANWILNHDIEGNALCKRCYKHIVVSGGRTRSSSKKLSNNGRWKGGVIRRFGYILERCEGHPRATKRGHYVLQHILIYERYYNCCIPLYTIVHHKNEVRDDNRIENLELMSHGGHSSYHRLLDIQNQKPLFKRPCY